MFSRSYRPRINPVFSAEYKFHKFRREIVGSRSGVAEASFQVSWHMTPCRWASGFRRFERTCCLNVRGPAVRADPPTNTADEATAIVGTATNDQGSHPTIYATSLYKFLHSSVPPSHLLAESRQAVSNRLAACLSDVKRTSETPKSWAQPRGAVFNIPFRAGDYKFQFSGSIR